MSGVIRDGHRAFGWSAVAEPIAAGQSLKGFEIVSDLAPGYVPAAFFSRPRVPDLTPEEWASLPTNVAATLRSRMPTGIDASMVTVIGPRLAPGTPADMVFYNFSGSIQYLRASRLLPDKADTVAELQRRLYAILSGQAGKEDLHLDTLVRSDRVPSPKESEIIHTLSMTMEWLAGT